MLALGRKMGKDSIRWITARDDSFWFYWLGSDSGVGEMGAVVAEKWSEKMVDMRRINERLLMLLVDKN